MNKLPFTRLIFCILMMGFLGVSSIPAIGEASAPQPVATPRAPQLFPDYSSIVMPPNIAPLNFIVAESGTQCRVRIHGANGHSIEVTSRDGRIIIPQKPWRALVRTNTGSALFLDVAVKEAQAKWRDFSTVTNTIAREEIDGFLVYRLLKPLYNSYVNLGIYQRNLQNYEESVVLENRSFDQGCLNCHTFLNNHAEPMALHIRTFKYGLPMLLVRHGEVVNVSKTAGYMSWHPSGKLLAFSINKLSLFFHTIGENRDVYDAASDLGILDLDANTVTVPAPLAQPEQLETWPAWSPDGRHLYFCRAPKLPIEKFRQIRYDLMRIGYDLERNTWGEVETLMSAKETSLSAAQPKVSPDGRYLLFCLAAYGNFPVYQPSSDLYLMDLKTRQYRRLEINSGQADTWHCWSSNSRWIVFSSKRRDGLFARPYFSYFDALGRAHKPFLLPQRDPTFYDSFIKTYNVPELVREPVRVRPQDLARAILKPAKVLSPKIQTQTRSSEPPPAQSEGLTPAR